MNQELSHHGVKGMKWGVRKGQSGRGASSKVTNQERLSSAMSGFSRIGQAEIDVARKTAEFDMAQYQAFNARPGKTKKQTSRSKRPSDAEIKDERKKAYSSKEYKAIQKAEKAWENRDDESSLIDDKAYSNAQEAWKKAYPNARKATKREIGTAAAVSALATIGPILLIELAERNR